MTDSSLAWKIAYPTGVTPNPEHLGREERDCEVIAVSCRDTPWSAYTVRIADLHTTTVFEILSWPGKNRNQYYLKVAVSAAAIPLRSVGDRVEWLAERLPLKLDNLPPPNSDGKRLLSRARALALGFRSALVGVDCSDCACCAN